MVTGGTSCVGRAVVERFARDGSGVGWVGGSTVATILANRLLPGILDHYLARTNYEAQQTDEPEHPRPSNLWGPLPGDPGAHGRFDGQAHKRSAQAWAMAHRGSLAGAAAAIATAATAATAVATHRRR